MSWEKGTLADFLGDRVVYRNLEPMGEGLEGLRAVWEQVGFDHYYVPRKTSPAYAKTLLFFLERMQRQRGAPPLERLLFVGDTRMNDGTAARNLASHYPLMGFIGADRLQQERSIEIDRELMIANRWEALTDFLGWVRGQDFCCDGRTALLIDLDKTSLGARGRNDHVIDAARVRAVQRTMQAALGDGFSEGAFRAVYDPLNQPDYHYLTADNQDYLAYVCLMVSGGVYPSDRLWPDLEAGKIEGIEQFVSLCDQQRATMSPGLLAAHEEVRRGIEEEDPTPFKGFRRGEYFETVARMDTLPDDAAEADVLNSEIVITAEVASVAHHLAVKGVLVFGISDKPDEASVPTKQDEAKGYRAIHRTPMKVYGKQLV